MYVTIYYWRHQSMANSVAVRIIQSFHLRRQIVLRIPIDLDFKDSSKKDAIHRSWRYERNVPLFMAQLHNQIDELKKSRSLFRVTDMTIVYINNKGTFIDLILEDFADVDSAMKRLNEIFISLGQF